MIDLSGSSTGRPAESQVTWMKILSTIHSQFKRNSCRNS